MSGSQKMMRNKQKAFRINFNKKFKVGEGSGTAREGKDAKVK